MLRAGFLLMVAWLAVLVLPVDGQVSTYPIFSQSGGLEAAVRGDSSLESLQVNLGGSQYTLLTAPDSDSGWGACHDFCVCSTSLCPAMPTVWSGMVTPSSGTLHTEIRDSHTGTQLRVIHRWSPAGSQFPDVIRTNVTLVNDSGSTLDDVHYRRGEAFIWDDGASVHHATMSMGSNLPMVDLEIFLHGSSDMGMANVLPGSPFDEAPSGLSGTCPYTPGPGPATGGTLFQDVPESDRSPCQPGGMVELALGDIPVGSQRRFTMWHGFAANETQALHQLGPDGIHADFWFLAQSSDPNQAGLGVPLTFFWAFSELHQGEVTCQALGCTESPAEPCHEGSCTHEPTPPNPDFEDPAPRQNQPPVASFAYAADDANLQFWDTSSDVDGAVVDWLWDFGGGKFGQGRWQQHSFPESGWHRVRLTVWDDAGASGTDVRWVRVGPIPKPAPEPGPVELPYEPALAPGTPSAKEPGCGEARHEEVPLCKGAIAQAPSEQLGPPPTPLQREVVNLPGTDPLVAGLVAVGFAGALCLLWRLAGFVVLFSRLRRDDLLAHALRAELMGLIQAEPGLYVSELARRAGRSRNAVVHNLEAMAKAGLVRSQETGPLKRYFPGTAEADSPETGLRPAARKVLGLAQSSPGLTVAELAALAGMRYGAVHYHVRSLQRAGMLALRDNGGLRIFACGEGFQSA